MQGSNSRADLRRYLLQASDVVFGVLEPITVGGGHIDFEEVLRSARQHGAFDAPTPLCEDNGDYYCVTPSGEVVFWSHNAPTDETWPNQFLGFDAVGGSALTDKPSARQAPAALPLVQLTVEIDGPTLRFRVSETERTRLRDAHRSASVICGLNQN